MHAHSYLKSAAQIIGEYNCDEPFSSFLKKYFSANKKFGSKDRKQVSHLCYCYFRLGKAILNIPIEERILIGLFLCSKERNEILEQLKPEWNTKISESIQQKLLIIDHSCLAGRQALLIKDVFPWKEELSEGMEYETFCESFFVQPGLFIRLRPGHDQSVKTKLDDGGIRFSEITSSCLSLPNASKIENIIQLDKEAVVQDLNSQQTAGLLKNFKNQTSNLKLKVWDCCAGSGGKSLMLYDIVPHIELTVSDIRESILANLQKRFLAAGIKNYNSVAADLQQAGLKLKTSQGNSVGTDFDLILCDAPCTGSGTWSRTPEQLYFFNEKVIDQYSSLQKKIVSSIILHLKEEGYLLYITCSVFKKENEEVVDFILSNSKLELIKMELLKGYDKKADTMFAALLKKIIA